MTEDDGLDLSALDPTADPERWRSLTAQTLDRVGAVLARRAPDPLTAIAGWTRPLLLAAGLAVALLIPVELVLETRETEAERVQRLVSLSTERGGVQPPSGADFLRALHTDETP